MTGVANGPWDGIGRMGIDLELFRGCNLEGSIMHIFEYYLWKKFFDGMN